MAEETASTTAAVETAAEGTTTETAAAETVTRTFTQSEVNALLARQKRAFVTGQDDGSFAVPNEFKQMRELREKAEEFDKLQEAQKSELERANEARAKAERDTADALARAQETMLRSSIISEAAKRNVVDPDAAVALIDRASLEFADDGSPTNIAAAMDALLTAKPYLAGTRAAGSADQGARGGGGANQITRDQLASMSPDEVTKALSEGRLAGVLAGK